MQWHMVPILVGVGVRQEGVHLQPVRVRININKTEIVRLFVTD